MAVTALLKLAGFMNERCYVNIAHEALAQMQTPTAGGMTIGIAPRRDRG
jgi:hypothetical protein